MTSGNILEDEFDIIGQMILIIIRIYVITILMQHIGNERISHFNKNLDYSYTKRSLTICKSI